MGIGQSKNEANKSMEDIKSFGVDEKTRADTLSFPCIFHLLCFFVPYDCLYIIVFLV